MPICNNPPPQVQEPAAPGAGVRGRRAAPALPEGPCPSGPPCQDRRGPGPAGAPTLATSLRAAEADLARAGCDSPRLDAQILIADALGTDRTGLLLGADRRLSPAERRRIARRITRRAAHEPVGRILGVREFWSLPFRLGPATLEPRPDSETLVETVLDHLAGRRQAELRLLDLGTGTGCLLLALLHELPAASGLGLDIAPGAVRLARRNATALGLAGRARFRRGDLRAPRPRPADGGLWDVVLSNPPYIPAGDIPALAPDLAFDPAPALDGGPDGLDFYRAILGQADACLAPGGVVVVEIGHDQASAVMALGRGAGLSCTERRQDLGGRDRVLVFGRI